MAMYPDRSAVLVWLREDVSGTAQIVARYVSANNQLGPMRELVDVSAERLSGFPKLTFTGDEVVLAWTDVTGPFSASSYIKSSHKIKKDPNCLIGKYCINSLIFCR